jgi:hypothetical protein
MDLATGITDMPFAIIPFGNAQGYGIAAEVTVFHGKRALH